MLNAIYHMLTHQEPYRDLGATYLDERNKVSLIKRTERRFKDLGYRVVFEPIQPVTA